MMEKKIYVEGNVVWFLNEMEQLGDLTWSGFLQDANCCFKISTDGTPIEDNKNYILSSIYFDSNEEAQNYANNQEELNSSSSDNWDWDSDGFITCVYDGHALYVGATAVNGGNPETKESIERMLRCVK